jgi:parallel beta-helix repeat protein
MGIELWNRIYAASVVGNSVSQVDYGISLAGVTNSVVTGNVLSGVTAYGIEVGSASNGCVVNSNSIRMYTLGTSTKGGLSGILSSGVSSYYCEISDNVVIGCAGYGIYIVNSNYFNVVGNTLQDNATIQFYLGTSNYLNVTDNILNGTTQNFIFLDATSASMTDIEISNNIIRGSASSYGIWFTNATNPARTITNLRIIKNNVYAATAALKGNYSIFWTVSGWDMYNTVIEKNFFRDGGSYFVLPDWTSPDVVVRTMVLNGTMELNSNWNTSGATTNERSTTQKHSGTYSRKVVTNGANTGIYSDEFHLTSGYAYRATAWVYGNGVGVGYVKIYVPGGTDSYSPLSSLAGYVWPAAWTKQEWTFIADNNVQISNIMLMQGTVGGAGTFYLDDVSVVEDRLNVIGNAHISGRVNMSGLTDYANNAAAVAAGLAIGDIYHITGTDTLGVVHP